MNTQEAILYAVQLIQWKQEGCEVQFNIANDNCEICIIDTNGIRTYQDVPLYLGNKIYNIVGAA